MIAGNATIYSILFYSIYSLTIVSFGYCRVTIFWGLSPKHLYIIQKDRMGDRSVLVLLICCLVLSGILCDYTCNVNNYAIQLGKPIFICVHLVYYRNTGTVVQLYAFNATTDKFSAFKVNNLSTTLAKETTPVSAIVQVANSNITLELLLFNPSIEGGIYRSLLSFVVNIDGGAVTAITDDTAGCDSCDTSNKCNTNTASKCYNTGSGYAGSDPRLFISWIGTDASGNHMLSHTKRLSRFTQYSIGSIYSSVVNSFK